MLWFVGLGGKHRYDVCYVDIPSLNIGPGGFACATRGGIALRSWPLLLPSFALLSFFALFSPSFAFDPLRRISRVGKFVSANILAKLEDKFQKKNI